MLVAERAASSYNSNLHGLEQLEDAGGSDDNLTTELYTVYSEPQTPTFYQLPLRSSIRPRVSYSLLHPQYSIGLFNTDSSVPTLARTLTLTLTFTFTFTLTLTLTHTLTYTLTLTLTFTLTLTLTLAY
jgi:hypothetical protein